MPTFAAKSHRGPYHIVEQRGDLTVCGLKVSKLKQSLQNGILHVVEERPPQAEICKHCERLSSSADLLND